MQTIKMRDTGEVFRIQDMVFPMSEMSNIYIRMIVVDEDDNPTHFLITTPDNILYRTMTYDQELMNEIIDMSETQKQAYLDAVSNAEDERDSAYEEEHPTAPGYYG